MTVTVEFISILLFLSVVFDRSLAMVVICDPTAAPQAVTVGINERVAFMSKGYPSPYPLGSCDVSFQPATSDTILMLVFENYKTVGDEDIFEFYANVTNNTTGNTDLQVVASVGPLWHSNPNFLYPQSIRGPTGAQNYSGIIQTRFNAKSTVPAAGFKAHVIGYDITRFNPCLPLTYCLAAEESFLAISPGAPFFDSTLRCNWNVKPADNNTRLVIVLNYANLPYGQVLISTDGLPDKNISGSNYKLSDPDAIMGDIANVISFQYSRLGSPPQNDSSSLYIIVIRAWAVQPGLAGNNSCTSTSSVPTSSSAVSSTTSTPMTPSSSPLVKSISLFVLMSVFIAVKSCTLSH